MYKYIYKIIGIINKNQQNIQLQTMMQIRKTVHFLAELKKRKLMHTNNLNPNRQH